MKKIVIVGGGISGLTSGIFAQKYGFESIVLEKNSVAGGECTGWDRQGSYIDGCIHWLTGTKKNTELYDLWCEVGALDGIDIITILFVYVIFVRPLSFKLNKLLYSLIVSILFRAISITSSLVDAFLEISFIYVKILSLTIYFKS